MANTVGFSLPSPNSDNITSPVASPPQTRSSALLGATSNSSHNITNSNNNGTTNINTHITSSQQQLDFKSWFFQTATINQPEASGATSPRHLRRILRRAWKALERSPYYKTLRSEHAAGQLNSPFGDISSAEFGSRSAPGSPPRHRFKKNAKSKRSRSPLKRNGSHGSESSDNEQPMKMRPSTANANLSGGAKVRPFSAGSVGSTSSSEASESGNATSGGDDPNKKLIPTPKRPLFPPSKVRPKSSGILRNAQPQTPVDDGSGKNVAFTTVDETAGGVSRRQSSQSASSGRRSGEEDGGQTQMVIDTSNANADTAQLVTIQEGVIDSGSSKPPSASSKKGGKGKGKQPFADLKIIDETGGKGGGKLGSAKGGSKKSSSGSLSGGSKKGSANSVSGESGSKTSSSANLGQTGTTTQPGSQQAGGAASGAPGASTGGTASSARQPSSTPNPFSNAATNLSVMFAGQNKEQQQQSAAFSTQDSMGTGDQPDDGSSSKGSKSTKDGSKPSLLKKIKEDTSSKPAATAGSDSGSGKDSSSSKQDSSKTSVSGGKDSSKDSSSKDAKKGDSKKESGDQGSTAKKEAQTPAGAALATEATAATGTPAGGTAPAEGGAATTDDKAPLKREMSRISVKTNESRKSIDMSKHIMNLIHGGQAQEEQTKKPQTTNQSYIQQAIPALPMAAAVICLLLNLFAPGIGTMISGLLVLCIGKPRIEAKENAVGLTIFVNFFVGISQLMTVTFFFVGWFWSMVWGINLIINSIEYGAEMRAEREKELQQTAMRAFGFIRADAAPAVDE